jgi:hypothetical protein
LFPELKLTPFENSHEIELPRGEVAIKLTFKGEHPELVVGFKVKTGAGVTVTITSSVEIQPLLSSAVTEYVVVVVAVKGVLFVTPLSQTIVAKLMFGPKAFNTIEVPEQVVKSASTKT